MRLAGNIQPIGYLLAFEKSTGLICYASENLTTLFSDQKGSVFGRSVRDVFGGKVWHGVTNALAMLDVRSTREQVGVFYLNGNSYAFSASPSGP